MSFSSTEVDASLAYLETSDVSDANHKVLAQDLVSQLESASPVDEKGRRIWNVTTEVKDEMYTLLDMLPIKHPMADWLDDVLTNRSEAGEEMRNGLLKIASMK